MVGVRFCQLLLGSNRMLLCWLMGSKSLHVNLKKARCLCRRSRTVFEFVGQSGRGGQFKRARTLDLRHGDLLMPLIADYLNLIEKATVRLSVWNVRDGKLQRVESYPNGEDAYQRTIHLLQTNAIVPHYDLMRQK
jgi:hypothetical protein